MRSVTRYFNVNPIFVLKAVNYRDPEEWGDSVGRNAASGRPSSVTSCSAVTDAVFMARPRYEYQVEEFQLDTPSCRWMDDPNIQISLLKDAFGLWVSRFCPFYPFMKGSVIQIGFLKHLPINLQFLN
ncbi:hypothetical protein WA026_020401 [Henosepilachna vigintioctopunctata]|uniref:Uncharacterized protein n=1 Tax=Henosepilachna vigintioctopunctata TaxID=420089 RepID=A0AAW1UP33_9CUCU